ncbi:uncharacterized protein LOC131245779 isoform X2 [Magnolia sinica]|uniref:uncharacterized protein LOC131245779 isoform X2 n=1 Tax=Magnolia sinica TaxID=86752 RepID=UPI002657FF96|nr:uncharacterized protein LOC131245779 isoform X2 [Magnolia sinica]
MLWLRARLSSRWRIQRFSSAACRLRRIEDEGDWFYSSEWWGTESDGHTVFQSNSVKGNGDVSVVAYPSSRPDAAHWPAMEKWLQERTFLKLVAVKGQLIPNPSKGGMISDLKSMVSAGLASLASCNYDFIGAVCGKKIMRVLCIGHGGGSLPLFLASKIQGAVVHVVEIDPVVISASVQAMGFPASAVKTPTNSSPSQPDMVDHVLWKGISERLFLYEADAENFVLDNNNIYDLIFIDAYDGDDIFPHKLWDPHGPFLGALRSRLHPEHGTVVVNLHADSDVLTPDGRVSPHPYHHILPMGKYVSQVCRSYKDTLLGKSIGKKREVSPRFAFIVSVPWLCNISLVVSKGTCLDRHLISDILRSKSRLVEDALDLPFSSLQYIKRDFIMVD